MYTNVHRITLWETLKQNAYLYIHSICISTTRTLMQFLTQCIVQAKYVLMFRKVKSENFIEINYFLTLLYCYGKLVRPMIFYLEYLIFRFQFYHIVYESVYFIVLYQVLSYSNTLITFVLLLLFEGINLWIIFDKSLST